MVGKKPKVINFDTEVLDGRSVLEAYRTILNQGWVELIYGNKRVELSDVLRRVYHPESGFKKGVLPDHIRNVSIAEERGEQVVLSYNSRLDHELEKKYWEERRFSTRTVKKLMQVLDTRGKVVVTYGLNRVLIERDRLDQFIENMRQ